MAIVAGSAVIDLRVGRDVPAVVQSWYSGMEGGHGLADVLRAGWTPADRLPFSRTPTEADLPAFEADSRAFTYDLWHGYWHLARNGTGPAYPFGFGLSYTSFSLQSAGTEVVDGGPAGKAGSVRVTATVANTGERTGTDVVQVYGRRLDSGRPERLVGFRRLEIGAGRSARCDLDIPAEAFAEWDAERRSMVVRPATYQLRVAHHATDPGITSQLGLG